MEKRLSHYCRAKSSHTIYLVVRFPGASFAPEPQGDDTPEAHEPAERSAFEGDSAGQGNDSAPPVSTQPGRIILRGTVTIPVSFSALPHVQCACSCSAPSHAVPCGGDLLHFHSRTTSWGAGAGKGGEQGGEQHPLVPQRPATHGAGCRSVHVTHPWVRPPPAPRSVARIRLYARAVFLGSRHLPLSVFPPVGLAATPYSQSAPPNVLNPCSPTALQP